MDKADYGILEKIKTFPFWATKVFPKVTFLGSSMNFMLSPEVTILCMCSLVVCRTQLLW